MPSLVTVVLELTGDFLIRRILIVFFSFTTFCGGSCDCNYYVSDYFSICDFARICDRLFF